MIQIKSFLHVRAYSSRRILMTFSIALGLNILVLPAKAEPDFSVGGAMLAETCSGCHGTDGQSVGPMTPTLSGMDKDYFVSVMKDFRNGVRHSTIMERIAKAYSDEELEKMADHFSQQTFQAAKQVVNLEKSEQGKLLHDANCSTCHTDQGQDKSNGILAGQWLDYLHATVDDFVTGKSDGVPPLMVERLRNLTNEEVSSLVHFYANHGAHTQLPQTPVSLRATITSDAVTLSWLDTNNADRVDRFEVQRNDEIIAYVKQPIFTDTSVASGSVYGYRIVAIDTAGNRSDASSSLAARIAGDNDSTDIQISNGRTLWQANNCQSCHGVSETFASGADLTTLLTAINTNKGGMGRFSHLTEQDLADVVAYVQSTQGNDDDGNNGDNNATLASIDGVVLMSNRETLRKAAILLAGRQPTQEEYTQAETDEGLRVALRGFMQGKHFRDFIYETGNIHFLTAGAAGLNTGGLNRADFPALRQLRGREKRRVHNGLKREPLELLRYIIENDRPYTEIVTADYTMVNRHTAAVYGAELIEPFEDESQDSWVPARVVSTSARSEALSTQPYPHAGVLTTNAWLSRFPTTDSNRNRHRAKMVFEQFLGFDIEALGQRPLDDSANDNFLVPTLENPSCTVCHSSMDPVAGAFQNWGDRNRYWQKNAKDSLANDYKSKAYQLNYAGEPWYHRGDIWYRDVLKPGFNGKSMPGAWNGFNREDQSDRFLPRNNWTVVDVISEDRKFPASKAFDDNPRTMWHTQWRKRRFSELPHHITIDFGSEQIINGLQYTPRQRGKLWHIQDYRIEVSQDGETWSEVADGAFNERNRDAKQVEFAATPARFIKFIVDNEFQGGNYTAIAELHVLKPLIDGVPYEANNNGGQDSLQWLARELVNDQRFAKGAVMFWYEGLFGRKPIEVSMNPDEMGYATRIQAFALQEGIFHQLADNFRTNGFNVRDLLVDLMMSDLFRAGGLEEGVSDSRQAVLSEVGMGHLLGPDELDRKVSATLGGELFSGRGGRDIALLYGGFDGGQNALERNTDITPLMLSAVESRIYGKVCDSRVVHKEFRKKADQRKLFPHVDVKDVPSGEGVPVLVEYAQWNGLGSRRNNSVSVLTDHANYPDQPSAVKGLTALEAPRNAAGRLGSRMTAMLKAPTDGEYTFWIAGDDYVQLWLSTDNDAANRELIAYTPRWTRYRQWDRYSQQRSQTINLKAGETYYVEVLHVDRGGPDHVSVAWQGPGFERQVISSNNLVVSGSVSRGSEVSDERIRQNLQHLHEYLLGESLNLDDPEIDRSYALFKEIYESVPDQEDGLQNYCDARNGADPTRRAWTAVLTYLMSDFRYLND